jgi:hypothetical protein
VDRGAVALDDFVRESCGEIGWGGDVVVRQVGVGDLAVAELDRLEQRGAEADDQRLLVLQRRARRVDDLAGVRDAV